MIRRVAENRMYAFTEFESILGGYRYNDQTNDAPERQYLPT